MVALGYFVPLMPTLAASDWTRWKEGGWSEIALATAARSGRRWRSRSPVAGMVSALALFNALLLAFSRIPLAMAVDGLLPTALARTDARGTPRGAVLFAAVCYSIFTLLPFAQLVVADSLLYALAMFLEFGALLALRRREPGLRGPFRIPLSTGGVAVLAMLPLTVFLAATGFSLAGGEYGATAVLGAFAAAAVGPFAYRVAARGAQARRAAVAGAAGMREPG
jgi:amino acid transporter